MYFFPKIFMIASGLSILSFLVSEMGLSGIPVFYPVGIFLHEYWFADYAERFKRHYGNYATDGPPLTIIASSDSGPIPWPYAAPGASIPSKYTDTYQEVLHEDEKYTPVDGVGGVIKESIKTGKEDANIKYCFPQAVSPNDYIAARFLGAFSTGYGSLKEVSQEKGELYNKNVFKGGSPFLPQVIGPNDPNNPLWDKAAHYGSASVDGWNLLVPLTTQNVGHYPNSQVSGVYTAKRDYSGGEYTESEKATMDYTTTKEHNYMNAGFVSKPAWYQQDQTGEYIGNNSGSVAQSRSVSYAGDEPYIGPTLSQSPPSTVFITPEFTTSSTGSGPHGILGWGESATDVKTSPSPNDIQKYYIQTQLMQENPIIVKK